MFHLHAFYKNNSCTCVSALFKHEHKDHISNFVVQLPWHMIDCISITSQVLRKTRNMTPATLAMFLISLVIFGTATDVAPATKQQFQFFPSFQEHEKSHYYIVEGTNSSEYKDKSREPEKIILYL